MKKYRSLILWVLVFEVISFLIGMSTESEISGWYQNLTAPPGTPPNIAFPIMWTFLYALIAAAGWTLWRNREKTMASAPLISLFVLYMGLNWSWSYVFFSAHLLLISFIWILLLNLVAVIFIIRAWKPLKSAALLMIPPTLWTFFAAYLNGGYWWLN